VNTTETGGVSYAFQELRNHAFTVADNGKKLRCVVIHETITDEDGDSMTAIMDINIACNKETLY